MAFSQLRNSVVAAVLCSVLAGHPAGCSARSLLGGDGAARSLLDAGGYLRAYLDHWNSQNKPPAGECHSLGGWPAVTCCACCLPSFSCPQGLCVCLLSFVFYVV